MRELTVKVSDNQFDTLVNYLRTLPYVQVPSILKNSTNESTMNDQTQVETSKSEEPPFDIAFLGEMDNTPFDIEYITKNHSIQWQHLDELKELFKDIPLENYVEEHTIIHSE